MGDGDDDDDDDGDRGINAVDSLRGMSAVCWAAKFGRADALSTLTQSGCRPTARAAMCAIQGASQALTATQLSKSSTTNGAWVDDEAVIEATTERYLDTARAVLEAYVRDFSCGGGDASSILDVISTDARGWTPLTFAARKPRLGVPFVALLLDFGADPNLSDAHGRSPLVHAALAGDADVARVLIHRGADINFRDVDGFTPAMHAAFRHPASVDLSLALSSASHD
jgi:ankyrin repeat protein